MPRPLLRDALETPRPPVSLAGILVVQTVLVLGHAWALWALAGVPDERKSLTIAAVYAPIEIIAAALLWRASRVADGPARRGWTLVAAAMSCSALVNLEWLWVAIDPGHAFHWPSFVIVFAQFPLTLWALASFSAASGADVDRRRYLLDSAIVLTASAVLAWHFVFRDLLTGRDAPGLVALRAVAYTALCLTILSTALTLFVRRPPRRLRVPLALLTAGWAVWTLANTLQMRATVRGTSLDEMALNASFAAGAWLMTLAAFAFLVRPRIRPTAPAHGDRAADAAPGLSLLPYAAIAAVFGVLLREARRAAEQPTAESTSPLVALVAGAIAITAVVVVRQALAQRSNQALVAERLRHEAHFRALVQHASDVILVVDASGVVREASPSVAHTLGYPSESLVGRPITELAAADDRALVRADLAEVTAAHGGARPSAPCEWRLTRSGGEARWLEVLCTNLLHDPAVAGIVVNGRDVSERKALEAELTRQAYHDALTGLVNRARFRDIVEMALGGRIPSGDAADRTSVAVLYIDLDGFKPVNDTLGHEAGDRVLAVVTERLRDATRGSDVVARLGGDEFAVLLEHVRDVDEAAAVARRVLARVQQPITAERAIVHVGASIGIACTAIGGEGSTEYALTCEALLRDADEAMYAAKAQGGRRYVIYAPRVARPDADH